MAFIATGREVPEVRVGDDFVEVTLAAGKPDVEFVKALHNLENEVWQSSDDGGLTHNVHALLILWHLWTASIITMKKLQSLTQASRGSRDNGRAVVSRCGAARSRRRGMDAW